MLQRIPRTTVHVLRRSVVSHDQMRAFHSSMRTMIHEQDGIPATPSEKLNQDVAVLKTDFAVLKTDVAVLKTDVAVLKTDVAVLKTDVTAIKTDMNSMKMDIKTDINSIKMDIKDQLSAHTLNQERQLSAHALNQERQFSRHAQNNERQFSQFLTRCLFGVLGLTALLVGSSWIIPVNDAKRLDVEIKRRALVRQGVDESLKEQRTLPDAKTS